MSKKVPNQGELKVGMRPSAGMLPQLSQKVDPVKRGSQIKEPTPIGPICLNYARSRGWPDERSRHQWELFQNFHMAKGSIFKNWIRAWYTWVLKWEDYNPQPQKTSEKQSIDVFRRQMAAYEERKQKEAAERENARKRARGLRV